MLDDLRDRINNKDDSTFTKTEKEALKFLLSCLEYHSQWRTLESANNFRFSPNIEELALLIRRVRNRENFLPYAITGNWADKLVNLETEFRVDPSTNGNLFLSIERKIKCHLLPEWLKVKSDNHLNYLQPMSDFFASYPTEDFRLDVFTLNNDTAIEQYFQKNYAMPWRGFSNGLWIGLETDSFPNDFGRINLYKLHGSLDWVRLTSDDFKEKDKLVGDENQYIDEGHNPYVIFGQGTKTFSIEPFFSLIQHFRRKLNEKKYFFVVGYSFFDPYINNLFIEAVRGTSKKIVIINPYFGPDKIKRNGKPDNEGEFMMVRYPDNSNNLDLAAYIRGIQENSFYSELPEFNAKAFNADSICFLPIGTSEFFQKYFQDKGALFLRLIEEFEKERRDVEEPFK